MPKKQPRATFLPESPAAAAKKLRDTARTMNVPRGHGLAPIVWEAARRFDRQARVEHDMKCHAGTLSRMANRFDAFGDNGAADVLRIVAQRLEDGYRPVRRKRPT